MKDECLDIKKSLLPNVYILLFVALIVFAIWHLLYIPIFYQTNIIVLFNYNIFSSLFYIILLMHLIISKNNNTLNKSVYKIINFIAIEINVFTTIATILMGWDYNFQMFCFGTILIIMLQFYISNKGKLRAITLTCCTIAIFVFLRIYTYHTIPTYQINNETLIKFFNSFNVIVPLAFSAWYSLWFSSCVFKYEHNLLNIANYDALTGLANRRYLDNLKYNKNDKNLCVSIIDIDDFKKINDTYGHDIGDEVLKHLSEILKKYEFENEGFKAIRWGGEEFVLIYDNKRLLKEDIILSLDHLQKKIAFLNLKIEKKEFNYHVTMGTAFANEAKSYDELLKLADKRLYFGKMNGKNIFVYE